MIVKRAITIVAALVILVAAVFILVATVTPGWLKQGDTHVGLWKACYGSGDNQSCNDLEKDCHHDGESDKEKRMCDEFQTTRAFSIMATVFAWFAFFALAFAVFKEQPSKAGIGLCLITAVFGLIAMAVFAGYHDDLGSGDLDYSFALMTVGWVIAGISAIAFGWATM